MGYTHYWTKRRDLTTEERERFLNYAEIIVGNNSETAFPLSPELTVVDRDRNTVIFNGDPADPDDLTHEDFWLELDAPVGEFQFCKTARKPYDTAVTAVLLALDLAAHKAYAISSDGDEFDWTAAETEVSKVAGFRPEIEFNADGHLRISAFHLKPFDPTRKTETAE